MAGKGYTLKLVRIVSQNIAADKRNVEQSECDNIDGKNESFFCKVCQLGFSTLPSLKVHLLDMHIKQTGAKCFICKSCKKSFPLMVDVMEHLQSKYITAKIDACFKCGSKFTSQRSVPFNNSRYVKSLELYCDACQKKIVDYEKNEKLKAINEPFVCKICPLGFSTLSSLDVHLHDLHIKKVNYIRFICLCCAKSFKSNIAVMKHMHFEYTEEKIDFCFKCGSKFPSRHSVPVNDSRFIKPLAYYCDVCRKKIVDYEENEKRKAKAMNQITDKVNNFIANAHQKVLPDKEVGERPENGNSEGKQKLYCCEFCQESFPLLPSFERHLRLAHPAEKPYVCEICEKKFARKRYLISHCLNTSNHCCNICQHEFSSKSDLQDHRLLHADEKPYACDKCEKKCKTKQYLSVHRRKHKNEKHVCDVCQKQFTDKSNLRIHYYHSHREKIHSCTVCEKRFMTMFKLKLHLRTHTGEKPFLCEICGRRFVQSAHLKTHMRWHKKIVDYEENVKRKAEAMSRITDKVNNLIADAHQKALPDKGVGERPENDNFEGKQKLYCCEFCQESFPSLVSFERHLRLAHPAEKPYVCNVCEKKFARKSRLIAHCVNHTLNHCCNICQHEFSSKSDLQTHRLLHADDKPYACDKCEKKCKTKQYLSVHRRKHKNENHVCDVCQKQFTDESNLRVHYRNHGEKIHSCPVCEKRFTTMSRLKSHFRTHTGEKPFLCEICGKGFVQGSHLKSHMRWHTGEKPFVCNICHRGFTQKSRMHDHRRVHTGEKPFQCDVCQKGFISKAQLNVHKRSHLKDKSEK